MLRELRPDLRIAHFSHTPWAPPDYFRLLPDDVARETLLGMLGADHAGLPLDALGGRVRWTAATSARRRGRPTQPTVHVRRAHHAARRAPARRRRRGAARAGAPSTTSSAAGGAARAGRRPQAHRPGRPDGAVEEHRPRAAGLPRAAAAHPEWRGRVVHVAFAYPSRHDLPEYREYTAPVQRLAARDRGRVRHRGLAAAAAARRRRLPALAGRLPAGGRAARQPGARRHEPGRQGGAGRVGARLRARAVTRGRRGRRARRRRARWSIRTTWPRPRRRCTRR